MDILILRVNNISDVTREIWDGMLEYSHNPVSNVVSVWIIFMGPKVLAYMYIFVIFKSLMLFFRMSPHGEAVSKLVSQVSSMSSADSNAW